WHSLGTVPGFHFEASGAAPDFAAPAAADVRPWVQFGGAQFLGSAAGLPAGLSAFLVLAPDAAIGLQAPQPLEEENAHRYSFQGLPALPDTAPEPGNLSALQLYPSGEQRYLLGGSVPAGVAPYPHQYLDPGPAPDQVFDHMSYYIHVKMLANG